VKNLNFFHGDAALVDSEPGDVKYHRGVEIKNGTGKWRTEMRRRGKSIHE